VGEGGRSWPSMSRRLLAGTEVEEDDMMLEVVVVF
jgi:hypothetical protein